MAQVCFNVMSQELEESESHQQNNNSEQNQKAQQTLQNADGLEQQVIEQSNQQQQQQQEQPQILIFQPIQALPQNNTPASIAQILEQTISSSQLKNQIFCFRYIKMVAQPIYFLLIVGLAYNNQQIPFCQQIWGVWFLVFGFWRFFRVGFHTFAIDFVNYYLWMIYFFGFDSHSLSNQFRFEKFMFLLINIDYFATWPSYIFIAFKFFKFALPQIIYLHQKNKKKNSFFKGIKKIKRDNKDQHKNESKQKKEQLGTEATNQEVEQDTCAICLSSLPTDLLPCKHSYHEQCIQQWLKQHNSCPICRVQFF